MQPNVVLRWRAIRPALCSLVGFLLVAVSGGGTFSRPQPAETKPLAREADPHGYALLANLAGDEKDVSKLRFIKRERLELKTLTQEIAATNRLAHEALEKFAKGDPALNLKDEGLPAAEVAARKAISKSKEKAIL